MEQITKAVNKSLKLPDVPKKVILKFLDKVNRQMKKMPQVIAVPDKNLIFVGDTHSDYPASMKIVKKYKKTHTIVFLGDYVDRAQEPFADIRNILFLFLEQQKNKKLVLLRGNHEDPPTNTSYGFRKSVLNCWDEEVWEAFNRVFVNMPLAAVNKEIIALHGGLPDVKSMAEIRKVPKGLTVGEDPVLDQILWNDCDKSDKKIVRFQNRGVPNAAIYGKKIFEKIMSALHKHTLIRAHDAVAKGWMFDRRCLTIMTSILYAELPKSDRYCDEPINGRTIAVVDKDKKISVRSV